VTVFRLPVSCPSCASDVVLVNTTTNGSLAVAVVECHPCEREWEVTARLVPHGRSRAYVERAKQSGQESKRRRREMVPA
jgi:transcription elongation factor Elf1